MQTGGELSMGSQPGEIFTESFLLILNAAWILKTLPKIDGEKVVVSRKNDYAP